MSLAALCQGCCCLLQGLGSLLSKLKQNSSPPFLALPARTHIAMSAAGTTSVLLLHFWALAGRGEEDAGGSY